MSAFNLLSDEELTSCLNEGSQDAFAEIYERYHSLLYAYAYKKLRNKEEAQDIIHEVLSTLWNKRFTLNLQSSLASYLFTAVRNKAFDLFAHKKVETKYLSSLQSFIEDAGNYADFLIRESQLKALIEKEIQALPPRMREVFELSRKERLSHKEIASMLNISEQTVSTQVKKALRVLRVRLGLFIWIIMIISGRL